jgi:hypothetical protein
MRWLIDRVNPSAEDGDLDQETPLFPASRNGKLEATRLLLDAGADANHRDLIGLMPLGVLEEGSANKWKGNHLYQCIPFWTTMFSRLGSSSGSALALIAVKEAVRVNRVYEGIIIWWGGRARRGGRAGEG